MNLTLHLKLVGILSLLLAALHLGFPRYFRWRQELAGLSLVNRQMMVVHTLFLALAVLLTGLLCLTSADELVATPLGRRVSAGLAIFWAVRLIVQFFGYSSELWSGKRFETATHVLFSLLWAYFVAVFALAVLGTDLFSLRK